MKKISGTKCFKTLTLLIILITALINCKKKKVVDSQTFSSWFINPSEKTCRNFDSVSKNSVDSLIAVIRKSLKTGTFTETLLDTSNTPWSLGYKTPEYIKSDSSYPLVIYLHGGTGARVDTKGERAFEMLAPLADSMQLFLASPSSSVNARWWSPAGLSRILQALRFMTLHYPIDSSKVFLAGVSDGATGCWAAANVIHAPFAGFFAISGYGGMLPLAGMKLHPENLMKRPIYNVNAGKDRLYPLEIVNRFLEYMSGSGVQVISVTYPDQDHGFDYREQEFGNLCNHIRNWSRPAFKNIDFRFVPQFPNLADNIFQWRAADDTARMCNVVCKEDTLLINAQGLQSLLIRSPKETGCFFARINNSPVKKITPYVPAGIECLHLMKYSCFPVFFSETLLKIKL